MTDGIIAGGLKRISPPWLQRTRGAAIVGGIGDVLDDVLELTAEGVRARWPVEESTALPYIGRDRRISRGIAETDDVYAARLRRWWIDHRKRGGAIAMLEQLRAYWANSPKRISLRYASGTWWTLDTDGSITRSKRASNADLTRWARMSVVYELDADPGPISYADYSAYMQIPVEWKAAHVVMRVIAIWPGTDLWGGGMGWGDGSTWGGGVVISDLFPDGVPPAEALTVGGYPLTLSGSDLTVTT